MGWEFCNCGIGLLPYTIVLWSEWTSRERQWNLPTSLAGRSSIGVSAAGKITLEGLSRNCQNWQIKLIKPINMSKLSIQETSEGVFFVSVSTFIAFQPFPVSNLSATRSQQNVLMHSSVKIEFESLFQTVKHENGEILRGNVDLGPRLRILGPQCS